MTTFNTKGQRCLRDAVFSLLLVLNAIASSQGAAETGMEQKWWDNNPLSVSARFAKAAELTTLGELVSSGGMTSALRMIVGGELGYVYCFVVQVRMEGESISAAKVDYYRCDSLVLSNQDAGDRVNQYKSGLLEPDQLGQIPFKDLLNEGDQFFMANKANTGPALANDTFVVMEQLSRGRYDRVDHFDSGTAPREANLNDLRSRFTQLIRALLPSELGANK